MTTIGPEREHGLRATRWWPLVLAIAPATIILFIVAVVALALELDMGEIFRDPAQVRSFDPMLGAMSSLGVILWWSTAAVCFFAFALARRFGLARSIQVFLATSALLTTLLAIDDQFLLHDLLASRYLGLRERHVMLVYLVLAIGYLALNVRIIRRSEWLVLLSALLFFAGSIGTDFLYQEAITDADAIGEGFDVGLFIEDGFKFLGIAAWSTYLIRFAFATLAGAWPSSTPRDGMQAD